MIAAEDVVLILLAAGRSQRFGIPNKLEVPFLNKPVGLHVVTAFEAIPFRDRLVVTDGCTLDFASHGYAVVHNDDPAAGMAQSVKLGVQRAKDDGAQAVLIALADMPRRAKSSRCIADEITPGAPARSGGGASSSRASACASACARPAVPASRTSSSTPTR